MSPHAARASRSTRPCCRRQQRATPTRRGPVGVPCRATPGCRCGGSSPAWRSLSLSLFRAWSALLSTMRTLSSLPRSDCPVRHPPSSASPSLSRVTSLSRHPPSRASPSFSRVTSLSRHPPALASPSSSRVTLPLSRHPPSLASPSLSRVTSLSRHPPSLASPSLSRVTLPLASLPLARASRSDCRVRAYVCERAREGEGGGRLCTDKYVCW